MARIGLVVRCDFLEARHFQSLEGPPVGNADTSCCLAMAKAGTSGKGCAAQPTSWGEDDEVTRFGVMMIIK